MHYEYIDSQSSLGQFCRELADESFIAFDTEFVSEDTYRPELCLIQVASNRLLAIIDPYVIDDLSPFCNRIATGPHETIVHAGREEFRFCGQASGRRPHQLFDVQIAAALSGLDYPASYGSLLFRVLGQQLDKADFLRCG